MSDQWQGPGWWEASDHRWYPPETHHNYLPPGFGVPRRRHALPKPPVYRRLWFIVASAVALVVVVLVVVRSPGRKPSPIRIGASRRATSTTVDAIPATGGGRPTSGRAATPDSGPRATSTPEGTTTAPTPPTRTVTSPVSTTAVTSPVSTTGRPPSRPSVPSPTPAPRTDPATTPPRPLVVAGCHARIGNPAPGDGGTDIVTVTSDVPNRSGTATMHYTTTNHAYAIHTGADGGASLTFSIGRPATGHRVDVTVTVGAATCSTSFMPRARG